MKKVAILGTDHAHYNAIMLAAQKRKDIKLTAISQENSPYADKTADSWNIKEYRNHLECLDKEKPDIVGIAMYNGVRGKWISECLRRGIPLIVDKPLCTTLDDLRNIKSEWEKYKPPLCMMLTCRCTPSYMAIKEALKSGMIGKVLSVDGVRYYALNRKSRPDWMFDYNSYGGPTLDILIHDYDLARWITNIMWNNVQSIELHTEVCPDTDFRDIAFLNAVDAGHPLNLKTLWHSLSGHKHRFTVYGTEGIIELPFTSKTPTLIDKTGSISELSLPETKPFAEQFFSALLDGKCSFPISAAESFELSEALLMALNNQYKNNGNLSS